MAQTNESQEQVTVNVETLQPVTRTLMTIGALPTSYLISMTYEEQLLWLQNYLIKTVIPAINNNAEATQEVQDIVMALQDYINTQFSELNLQEYIDNKLDEMLESGVFENILMDYVQLTKVYDTYNDMILDASTFTNGMKLKTMGYHFINDGGGADYIVTNVQSDTKYQVSIGTNLWIEMINYTQITKTFDTYNDMIFDTSTYVNGMKLKTLGYYSINDGGGADYIVTNVQNANKYQVSIGTNLWVEMINKESVNIKQLGAKGDGMTHPLSEFYTTLEEANITYPVATSLNDEISWCALQTLINKIWKKIIIPNGNYYINKKININSAQVNIEGNSKQGAILTYSGETDDYFISVKNLNYFSLYNISLVSLNDKISDGLLLENSQYFKLESVLVEKFKKGIHIKSDCYDSTITNSRIQNCIYGIHSIDGSDNNNISLFNNIIFYNDYGLYLGQGRNQAIYSCDIERNNICGIYRINSGDIEINNTYFELNNTNDIVIEWGSNPVDSVLINGCSFFQSSTNYLPISYHGKPDLTQITLINNNFVNNNSEETPFAFMQKSYGSTIRPTIINNSYTNFLPTNFQYFKGIILDNGELLNFQKKFNNINGTVDGNTNISLRDYKNYRVNLPSQVGTHTIILPSLNDNIRDYPLELSFIVPSLNANVNANGNITFAVDNNSSLFGNVTITKTDVNKCFKAYYLGYFNNKFNWVIS